MKKLLMADGNNFALVDNEDYDLVSQYKWHICKPRNITYAQSRVGYRSIYMHRVILGLISRKEQSDHINGNGLDNRRSNLRQCHQNNNSANAGKYNLKGYSQYKGVTYDKSRKEWRSQIRVNYKRINLGKFDTEIDAARAYNGAAKHHFGEFARLNIISP